MEGLVLSIVVILDLVVVICAFASTPADTGHIVAVAAILIFGVFLVSIKLAWLRIAKTPHILWTLLCHILVIALASWCHFTNQYGGVEVDILQMVSIGLLGVDGSYLTHLGLTNLASSCEECRRNREERRRQAEEHRRQAEERRRIREDRVTHA